MEGESETTALGAAEGHPYQRPPARPNLWLLVAMTAISLAITALVLLATLL